MFQDHSKISDASAVDQFKKFSLIAIAMSLFGLVTLHYIGAIGIVCVIRAALLAKHKGTQKMKDRTLYLGVAGVAGLVGIVDVFLAISA